MTTLREQITETFEGAELDKVLALVEVLGLDLDSETEITQSSWDDNVFEADGGDYKVLDEEEREEAIKEEIEESLWAFNPSFLAEATDWDLLPVFEAMQKADMCENANEPIKCLVEKYSSIEAFAELAVSYDGYGHFLSRYDGQELETENGDFFVYRQ